MDSWSCDDFLAVSRKFIKWSFVRAWATCIWTLTLCELGQWTWYVWCYLLYGRDHLLFVESYRLWEQQWTQLFYRVLLLYVWCIQPKLINFSIFVRGKLIWIRNRNTVDYFFSLIFCSLVVNTSVVDDIDLHVIYKYRILTHSRLFVVFHT